MREILLAFFAFMFTWCALAVLGMVVLRWRLGRNNRVSPAVKSPAPLYWLWAPLAPPASTAAFVPRWR